MKRLVLFAGFDKDGVVDDYVLFYLRHLSELADIIYVADCEMSSTELAKLAPYTIHAVAARHGEYDFGSYKRGFIYAKQNALLSHYDELFLCNDSVYLIDGEGLKNIVVQMERERESDVWGLFRHNEWQSGGIKEHLQSWFVALKKSVFLRKEFENFMLQVTQERDRNAIIERYEIGLSVLLRGLGFSLNAPFDSTLMDKVINFDVPRSSPLILQARGFPFLKIAAITVIKLPLKHLKRLVCAAKCDKMLIINHLKRTQKYEPFFVKRYKEFSLKLAFVRLYSEYSGVSLKYRIVLRAFEKKIFSFSLPVPKRLLWFDSQATLKALETC